MITFARFSCYFALVAALPFRTHAETAAPAKVVTAPVVVADVKTVKTLSVVRVNVTNQPWDFGRPWSKRPPYSRRAIGAVLAGNRVLVTAELVANATYVELETADGTRKAPASVEMADYECNLAVIKPDDAEFLKPLKPLEIAKATVGDLLSVWQLENNGNLLVTKGPLTTADVSRYPIDYSAFLIYRLTAPLQFRDSSFTLPVVKDDKLAGLLMRYDNTANNADVIPAPIIEHFLKEVASGTYKGFPRLGISYSLTRDPQFRRYLGIAETTTGGVYVNDVLPGSPAANAGILEGDLIFKVDGRPLDQDGNYNDVDYGKIPVTHLFSTLHNVGDAISFSIARKGESKEVTVVLAHRDVQEFVIEPYVIDRAPRFYVLGGLVMQELSRQYLKEWGAEWIKKAPENFVYFDQQQTQLFKNGPKKLVFLSRVLPSSATIGYEDLRSLIVKKINGVELQSLADIPSALAKATDGMHKIEFDGDPAIIYLDAAAVESESTELMQKYGLPALQRLE